MDDPDIERAITACRSDEYRAELEGDLVLTLASGVHTLRATDDKARHQLITEIRKGQHAELDVLATTFRQKDGAPNRRFLRHAKDSLPALAASYQGMPALRDHNTWSQASRIGTIRTSELHSHGGTGWDSFKMGLRIVKPEAVISVLDGTISFWSIGWNATGPVTCSVHKQDVRKRGSCSCWPGDVVEVDGASKIVEYEFSKAEGVEVSAVNVPAVKGTKIEDVRAALALELNFEPRKETQAMSFSRLAALLGVATLSTAADEDRAIAALEAERARLETERRGRLAAEQERNDARAELATMRTELASAKTAGVKAIVDSLLDGAYKDGKLRMGRDSEGAAMPSRFEPMLRKLAASEGVDALRQELAGMPKVVPLGERVLGNGGTDDVEIPRGGSISTELKSVAAQLGLDEKDVAANHAQGTGQEG